MGRIVFGGKNSKELQMRKMVMKTLQTVGDKRAAKAKQGKMRRMLELPIEKERNNNLETVFTRK